MATMNRRRLILTTLGALAGLPFASQVVKFISAEPEPKVPIAELYISVSQDVNAAIAGLGPYPVQTAAERRRYWRDRTITEWAERRGFDPAQEILRQDAVYGGRYG